MKIYLASSWRNPRQPAVVEQLRSAGHEVYDFRHPAPGASGFAWSSIDPNWEKWTMEEFRNALGHQIAERGFGFDNGAMRWADACVMLTPCGNDAHTELGWMAGAGKLAIVLLAEGHPPGLMLKVADYICLSMDEVLDTLEAGLAFKKLARSML